ncbi:MAG: acetate kinase [Candidatus Hydrogenedentota bacterium]
MKVLTLNCGSSSIKFSVIDTDLDIIERNEDKILVKGQIEKIGLPGTLITYEVPGKDVYKTALSIFDHQDALHKIARMLTTEETKIFDRVEDIEAVGHRIVHGGEIFSTSVKIDERVEKEIENCIEFAPLHNPHNLKGYRVAKSIFRKAPHVAIFDTGFHHTMPDYAYIYALPYVFYQKYKIRRYGFHGSSHRFVSFRVACILGTKREKFKIITIHLGNGCSICAIDRGRSVDTSMGFTPVEGLVMGTRGGDLDPAVILHIISREEITLQEADTLLNKHSGLYGVSGISSDLREILKAMNEGNYRARLAVDIFCYRLKRYISAYMGVLEGADIIVFTGGIGENAAIIREKSIQGLEFMGIRLDKEKNNKALGIESCISDEHSKVMIFVIPTNEELVIARDTVRCIMGII